MSATLTRSGPKPLACSPARASIGGLERTVDLFGHGLYPWQARVGRIGLSRRAGRWRYPVVVVVVPRQSGKTRLVMSVCVDRCLRERGRAGVVHGAVPAWTPRCGSVSWFVCCGRRRCGSARTGFGRTGPWDFRVRAAAGQRGGRVRERVAAAHLRSRRGQFAARVGDGPRRPGRGPLLRLVAGRRPDGGRVADAGDAGRAGVDHVHGGRPRFDVPASSGGDGPCRARLTGDACRVWRSGASARTSPPVGCSTRCGRRIRLPVSRAVRGGRLWRWRRSRCRRGSSLTSTGTGGAPRPMCVSCRPRLWAACATEDPLPPGRPVFAADVPLDRSESTIVACVDGVRRGGGHGRGGGSVAPRLMELSEMWDPVRVVVDAAGPAGTVAEQLRLVHDRLVVSVDA